MARLLILGSTFPLTIVTVRALRSFSPGGTVRHSAAALWVIGFVLIALIGAGCSSASTPAASAPSRAPSTVAASTQTKSNPVVAPRPAVTAAPQRPRSPVASEVAPSGLRPGATSPVLRAAAQRPEPVTPGWAPPGQSAAGAATTTVIVGNTGGDGVYLRRSPAVADKVRAWPDGTVLLVVGPDRQAEGRVWKNVRDPSGTVGWVPAQYLVLKPVALPRDEASTRPESNSKIIPLCAENGSCYGDPNVNGVPKTVHVRGYFRKDGTYVRSHFRSPPNSNPPKLRRR